MDKANSDSAAVIRRILIGLEGVHMPDDIRLEMLAGFRDWQAGKGTLEACLGLTGASGKWTQHPRNLDNYERRDQCIRFLGRLAGGTPAEQADQVAEWATRYFEAGPVRELRGLPFLAADYLRFLFESGARIPTSTRQLLRILNGARSQ